MSFDFNDSLMAVCEDDVAAFLIAKEFVSDDSNKHMLFCRLYKKNTGTSPVEKAESAKAEAENIWPQYQ